MSESTTPEAHATGLDEVKAELVSLRRRVDQLETVKNDLVKEISLVELRLETRIKAEEDARASEVQALKELWRSLTTSVTAISTHVANLSGQVRASHYSLVHLLAVTARQVKVSDKDLTEAMRMAKEAMP